MLHSGLKRFHDEVMKKDALVSALRMHLWRTGFAIGKIEREGEKQRDGFSRFIYGLQLRMAEHEKH